MNEKEHVKDMTSTVWRILGCVLLGLVALFCLGWFTGCSGDNGTSASVDTYTKKVCDYEVVRSRAVNGYYHYDISPVVAEFFGLGDPSLDMSATGWSLKGYLSAINDNFIVTDTFHIRGLYTTEEILEQIPGVRVIGTSSDTLVRMLVNEGDALLLDGMVGRIYAMTKGVPKWDSLMQNDYSESRFRKDVSELRRLFSDTIPQVSTSTRVNEVSCEDVPYAVEKDTTKFCYDTQIGFQYIVSDTSKVNRYYDRWVKETCLEWDGDTCAKNDPNGKIYITKCNYK
ncbi:hypothetical protein [Fibrobacter sp.]|uniref:hypothetical protein n=1 Tax=Fibrobacter sp. TaxID=35828 RepID=UPI003869EAA3